jgi:hypothetical protein
VAERYGQPQDRGRVIPTDVLHKMPAEKAIITAIEGGDWREPLRPPDEYQAYKDAETAAGH